MTNTWIVWVEKKMCVAFALQNLLIFCSQNINIFENTIAATVNEFVINKCFEHMGPGISSTQQSMNSFILARETFF